MVQSLLEANPLAVEEKDGGVRFFGSRQTHTPLERAKKNGDTTVVDVVQAFLSRSLAKSNFKRQYEDIKKQPPLLIEDLLPSVRNLILEFATRYSIPEHEARAYYEKVRERAFSASAHGHTGVAAVQEMLKNVGSVALRLYTTAESLHGRELCSILNEMLRIDKADHAVVLTRALNTFCITDRTLEWGPIRWPSLEPPAAPGGRTWRGGGLPACYRAFYESNVGRSFRVPMFLSTSASLNVAVDFMRHRGGNEMVLWEVRFHSSGRCQHVNFIDRHDGSLGSDPNVGSEDEFLFAPYSSFAVIEVSWTNVPTVSAPNRVVLQACADNKEQSESLLLAPWS